MRYYYPVKISSILSLSLSLSLSQAKVFFVNNQLNTRIFPLHISKLTNNNTLLMYLIKPMPTTILGKIGIQ